MGAGETPHASGAVVRGAAWAAVDNWIQQGVGLITFIAIGSLVGPRLYGIMAIGMTYHLLLGSLLRDTFGEALIQRRVVEREHFDTVFWVQIGLGLGATLLSFVLAGPVAALFQEKELALVIRVLGLTFPVLGAGNFFRCMLRRQLNFKALAIRSAFACGLSGPLAIVLALKGFGLWSLLAYQIALYGLDLLALAVQSRWRPRFSFSSAHYRELSDYSYKSMGNYLLANLGSQIDRLLIGYFVGAGGLGLYSMARRLVEGIDQTAMGVINAIALPSFAPLQHDHGALKRLLFGSTHFSMLVACPAYGGLGVIAYTLIAVLLPPEWLPSAPLLAILCVAGLFVPAMIYLAACQRAIGQVGLLLMLAVATMTLRVGLSLGAALAGYGVTGIAIGITAATLAMVPVRIHFAGRAVGLGARAYMAAMAAPLAATFIMMTAVFGAEHLVGPLLQGLPRLIALIVTGILVYGAALYLMSPGSIKQILAALRSKPGVRPAVEPSSP
jgi:polysaccharide transporter, PST family